MRLLLIEDDIALQKNIEKTLTLAHYSVDVADDGELGLYQAKEYPYDAAVIDIGLPKIDGLTVIKKIRACDIKFPILLLTARDSWQDKVEGLDAGADDYLTKPFHVEELVARLNALIRRSAGQASPIIQNGPMLLNTSTNEVSVDKKSVRLSGHEFKLLSFFMHHIEEVKSKSVLTEHIYDQDFDLDSNVIEVFIRRLRKKLDPNGRLNFIETLRGQGYKMKRLNNNES